MSDDNREVARIEQETTAVAPVSEKTISDYLAAFGLAGTLTKQEQMQFVEVAKAYNLNPFKRELYCVPHVNKETGKRTLSLITGYETYIKRAEHTGLLDGWECNIKGQGQNMKAVATIRRKGWSMPFKHEVYLVEYDQHNTMWKTKPRTMLKKVAIAQAFRLCFPDDMGGMPYTSDELPEEMTTIRDVTPDPEIKGDWVPQGEPAHEAPAPHIEPEKRKATPAEIEKLKALAKAFTKTELDEFYKLYVGAPDIMIEKMQEARIAKLEAGTLHPENAPEKVAPADDGRFSHLPKDLREKFIATTSGKQEQQPEPVKTVGENDPTLGFPDDSHLLYEGSR